MTSVNTKMPDFKGKTILIAEDEEINFLFIETLIIPTGAKVIHAWNGRQAIEFVKEMKVDLILMDIKMPIMDGFEATREIKKTHPSLPIIAQTAYALGDDRIHCFEAGCDEYLSKPIRKKILYDCLSDILG